MFAVESPPRNRHGGGGDDGDDGGSDFRSAKHDNGF